MTKIIGSLFLAAAVGCSNPSGPFPPAAKVLLISGLGNFSALNQTSQLTATLTLTSGESLQVSDKVTWASQDQAIATVSPAGLLKTIGFGKTAITATFQTDADAVTASKTIAIEIVATAFTVNALNLTAVGETGQLIATATLQDGSKRDVTNETLWSTISPQVITLDPATGRVTANALGVAIINARYVNNGKSFFQAPDVIITPPGTFAVQGRVRDPGAGGLNLVSIVHQPSGTSILSGAPSYDGYFTFGGLTGGTLSFSKNTYKPATVDVATLTGTLFKSADIPMQPVTRIGAGEELTRMLAPHDMDYPIAGAHCYPCQLIRVGASPTGKLHLDLAGPSTVKLYLWIDGVRNDAPDSTPGNIGVDLSPGNNEQVVYVGQNSNPKATYTQFTLKAVIR